MSKANGNGHVKMQKCTGCGKELPHTYEHFSLRSNRSSRPNAECRECGVKRCAGYRRTLRGRVMQSLRAHEVAGEKINTSPEAIIKAYTGFCHNPACGVEDRKLDSGYYLLQIDSCKVDGCRRFRWWLCFECNNSVRSSQTSSKLRGLADMLREHEISNWHCEDQHAPDTH